MAWLLVLGLLVTAMLAAEGIGAERRFSRSLQPPEPPAWEQQVQDALRHSRSR
jgi:hypothetical protein